MTYKNILLLVSLLAINVNLFAEDPVFMDTTSVLEVKLRDVVIKASKDNSKLKELPASVSIVTSQDIELNEINALVGFDGLIPNLFMPDYGSKLTSPIYIRGVGSRINSPAVGLYVDNVPFFEKASHNIDLFDIQSIEVLKGPQGSLYGKNARGGIINISTLSPMEYQGLRASVAAGTYGYMQGTLGYYGKAGEKFAYSLSGNYQQRDGFFTNNFDGSMVDESNSYSLRNRLVFKATDYFTVENIAFYENSVENGYPYAVYHSDKDSMENINYDHASSYERELFSNALVLDYEKGHYKMTSTTSYQYLADVQDVDQDFTPVYLVNVLQDQKLNQISQELVSRTIGDASVNWLLGFSGFYQHFDKFVGGDYSATATSMFRLPPGYQSYKYYINQIAGAAMFGQIKLDDVILENLTATLGMRVDYETEQLDYEFNYEVNGALRNSVDTIYPAINSLVFLPKLALAYDLGGTNIYATVARGYKSGGYNSTFERPEDLSFKPEFSMNYELGTKATLLNRQLYLDAALFYIDMKDQQIYQTVESGRGSKITNAGESVSKGGELTLKAIPICGFEMALNYGYTHATFTNYRKNDTEIFDGNFIPYAPRHTVSFNLTKSYDVSTYVSFIDRVRVNLLYRGAGETYWKEDNAVKEDYYEVIDGKISFIKGAYQLDIFGKNLTDTRYNTFYFTALGNEYAQMGKPMFIGAKLSLKL